MKRCLGCSADMDADAVFCNECGLAAVADRSMSVGTDPVFGTKLTPSKSTTGPRVEPLRIHSVAQEREDSPQISCPKCGVNIAAGFQYCPSCSHPFNELPPRLQDYPQHSIRSSRDGSPITEAIVDSARRRYKDAYYYARFIDTIGRVLKGIGLIGGGLIFLIGVFIMGSAPRSGIGSIDASVVGAAFLGFGLYAGLWIFVWWIWGVIWRSAGQFLKASLDGAVHSSPFLSDIDRAEVMSLLATSPTGQYPSREASQKSSGYPGINQNVPPLNQQIRTWLGSRTPTSVIGLMYLVPLVVPLIVFVFGSSVAQRPTVFGLIPSLIALPGTLILYALIVNTEEHRTNQLVRFHSLQALGLTGAWCAFQIGLLFLANMTSPEFEFQPHSFVLILNWILNLAYLAAIGLVISRISEPESINIPIVGDWARNRSAGLQTRSVIPPSKQ